MAKRKTKAKQISWTWYKRGAWWRRIRMNHKYKDRLFRYLFRDKKDLLALYNALNNSNYTNVDDLEIVTLEDVIFLKMKNDLSFIISWKLNLYEHQSTYNPNMPLRGLIYLAQEYEGLTAVRGDDLYGEKRIALPTPEYVVFYNGSRKMDDQETLYLSDSFRDGRGSGCLECRCEILNINRGHNQEIMEKCRRLWEYSEFTAEIDDNVGKGLSLQEALQKAIDCCIERDILKDILLKEKGEVQHMILTEYNEKKHMKTLYAQGREAGREEGREEERANTELQRQRAEEAENRAEEAESRAEAAEKEMIRLQEELQRLEENRD